MNLQKLKSLLLSLNETNLTPAFQILKQHPEWIPELKTYLFVIGYYEVLPDYKNSSDVEEIATELLNSILPLPFLEKLDSLYFSRMGESYLSTINGFNFFDTEELGNLTLITKQIGINFCYKNNIKIWERTSQVVKKLNDRVQPKLLDYLSNFPSLKELDLSGLGLKELPKSLKNLKCLETLHLQDNQLEDISDITYLHCLSYLDASQNKIENLPDKMYLLKRLTTLNIEKNELIDLPDSICELTNLEILDVSFNSLGTLPDNIGKLTKLKELRLYKNNLTFLPKSLQILSNLKTLIIGHNSIKNLDNIPKQIDPDLLWWNDDEEKYGIMILEYNREMYDEESRLYIFEEYWQDKDLSNYWQNEKILYDLKEEYQNHPLQELYEVLLEGQYISQSDLEYEFKGLFESLQNVTPESYIINEFGAVLPKYAYQIDEFRDYPIFIPEAFNDCLLPELNALTWESICFYLQQPYYFDYNLLSHYLDDDEADFFYQQVDMNPWIWAITLEAIHVNYSVEGEYMDDDF